MYKHSSLSNPTMMNKEKGFCYSEFIYQCYKTLFLHFMVTNTEKAFAVQNSYFNVLNYFSLFNGDGDKNAWVFFLVELFKDCLISRVNVVVGFLANIRHAWIKIACTNTLADQIPLWWTKKMPWLCRIHMHYEAIFLCLMVIETNMLECFYLLSYSRIV